MDILITGGCGFIGGHLSRFLLEKGHRITIIDNLSTSKVNIIDDLKKLGDVEFYNMNLASLTDEDRDDLNYILRDTDLVYHMAGSVGVKYIDEDPKGTLQNSFQINNNLFPLFENWNTKVVYASTSEVYGDTQEAKETDVLHIGSPDKMRWGYACSKLMSEFLLKSYNFPSVIVRFFNVTGEGQLPDYGMVLPNFVDKAKRGEPLIVYGNGWQTRTFCDVRDAVEMLWILGADPKHNGEIYNIGNSENFMSINKLADLVIEKFGGTKEYRDYEQDFSEDFDEIYERKPNTDKISQYYVCRYSTEDIIGSMA